MANPFGKRPVAPVSGFSQNSVQNGQQDPADYAAEMLKRSGGDAKAAFYLACQEKGIDGDAFIRQVQVMKNPQGAFQEMLINNPKVKSLMTLLNSAK